ncbi:PhaM family polyhydroxyalkanoate granule multifunctional regulatory protein [Undibacterium oligocarboniphilum]|uniref:Tfp pilus assembly protein FimV n=1 Tax=Undibacterium oligocarboniphilum TaxID=666702 RepID=A0A850QC61_9BURK|nr:PhaM family polyhydroxyalkanoate granule multifunctional regulatory protein [Undibacterium oligocarboniphilum]MBC3871000.1 hypothetical protein [Undibacterium oligocarboniphilum]NVO76377.1 hypothetical protein [Undibacterium oligocarboniphilum]
MSNPFGTEIPGMNSIGDPLAFIKKLWGSMNVPGMVAPPMTVDELDKKIQDLKTVESWLSVNMNMLRGTIQALEVQRATIAALQSIGESFSQHVQQAGKAPDSTAEPSPSQHADWPMPSTGKTASAAAPGDAATPEVSPAEPEAIKAVPESASAASTASAEKPEAATGGAFANPAAWWNLLQDQFKQAVSKAMENEPVFMAGSKPESAGTDQPAAQTTARKPAGAARTAARPAEPASAGAARKTAAKAPAKTNAKTATKTAAGDGKPVPKKTSR